MKLKKHLALAAIVTGILAGCSSSEESKTKYMERADAFYEQKDYEKARISYKNVLKIDPKESTALLGMGETLAKLKDWRGALGYYKAAHEADPENRAAKIKLAQIYLLANLKDEASELAESLLSADKEDTEALSIKAGILAKENKIREAVDLAQHIYTLDSEKDEHIVLLASLLSRNGDTQEAIERLEIAAKSQPTSTAIPLALTRIYSAAKNYEKAEENFLKLITLEPENLALQKGLALFYEQIGQPESAQSTLVAIISDKNLSEKIRLDSVLTLHDLFVARKDLEKAKSLLIKQIEVFPESYDLQFKLASYYRLRTANETPEIAQQNLDQARSIFNKLIEVDEGGIELEAKAKLAELEESQGNTKLAESLIFEVLEEHPGQLEALTIRARINLKKGDAKNAIGDFRTVLGSQPDSAELHALLANAHLINNEQALAIEMFEKSVSLAPRLPAYRIDLGRLYLLTNQSAKAKKTLTKALTMLPNNPLVLEPLLQVAMAENDVSEARNLVDQWSEVDQENPKVLHYSGLISQAEGDHAAAIIAFDRAISLLPGAVEPLSSKVKSLLALNKIDEAELWLTQVSAELKTNAIAFNLKGEVLMANKKPEQASKAFEQAISVNPKWWIPYRNKALLSKVKEDDVKALEELTRGIAATENAPGQKQLRVAAANLSESSGNYQEAVNQYEKIVESNQEDYSSVNNLAMLLVEYAGSDEKSLKRALALVELLKTSEDPLVQDTIGWVKYANGNYAEAVEYLKKALSKKSDHPEIHYHLGMAYHKLNDKINAKKHLGEAVQIGSQFKGKEEAKAVLKTFPKA